MTNRRRRPGDSRPSLLKIAAAGIAILTGARLLTFILAAAVIGGILLILEWLQ